MSFEWGEYTEGGGGEFISENEMLLLVATGESFAITGIRDGVSSAQYGSKPQYLVDFINSDGEEKTKSFSKGISERDGRFDRLRSTLEATGEPINARFIKVGRRYDVAGA